MDNLAWYDWAAFGLFFGVLASHLARAFGFLSRSHVEMWLRKLK